jgi:Ca-activated chloride channel family protein
MTFAEPVLLVGLLLLPLAALAYGGLQRRRRRESAAWANPALLGNLVTERPGWRRHVPFLLLLLSLAALILALARPQHTVAAVRREATVMLLTDTSGSMTATDVKPTRLAAAQAAARTFARRVPSAFRLGLITFGSAAQQLAEPTTDHARVIAAIDTMRVHGGTAMGDGIQLAVESARVKVPDGLGGSRRLPAAIVMLSDGASTLGADPIDVVGRIKKYKIPIYTVALGTANGELKHVNKKTGAVTYERVPPDPLVLQDIARDTGGEYFAAPNAQRLSAVYRNLSTRLAHVREKRQVTSAFAGGALVLLLAGAGFGLARGGRLP